MLSKNFIKYIQSLHQKKQRDAQRLFLAEGPKVVAEFLTSGRFQVAQLIATESWLQLPSTQAAWLDHVPVETAEPFELEKISLLQTPNEVIGVFRYADDEPISAGTGWTLALDDIRDPGNLGTLIRLADWFGLAQVICSEHTADCYNPKAVQASMGSLARVACSYIDLPSWLEVQSSTARWAMVLDGERLGGLSVPTDGVLVVGSESHGISAAVRAACSQDITIPRYGQAESLNAGVAAAIALGYIRGV